MKNLARSCGDGTLVPAFHPKWHALVWALFFAVASLALLPPAAFAQDAAGTRYEELVRTAIAAQETGDFARAYELFAEAHRLHPNARTLRALGVAAFQADRIVEAIEHLRAALEHPERRLDAVLRQAVEDLLKRAQARATTYRISVEPQGAWISLDGAPAGPPPAGPLLVLPGEHTLMLKAEGYEPQRLTLHATAGISETLHISLALKQREPAVRELPPVAALPTDHVESTAVAPRSQRQLDTARRRRVTSFVLLGMGAAAGITAGGLWFGAQRRVDEIADACRQRPASGCSHEERDAELTRAHISAFEASTTAMIVLAGASAAGAAGLWLWNRATVTPHVRVATGGASFGVSGRF